MSDIDPKDLARVQEILASLHMVESLEDYITRMFPREPPQPHLMPIIDLIERSRHEEVRATVSMPPRHGKTETICRGLAWRAIVDPACTHAFLSYAADLAKSKSRTIRRYAMEGGAQLSKDSKAVDEWRTTQHGGMFAAGVGGPLTGKGITGLAVVDDAIKNREDADSAANREKVWDWFNDVVYTRLEAGSSCIVVATRWHADDLIGRLHNKDYGSYGKWENISLPAVNDSDEPLWPSVFSKEKLDDIRAQLGEYGWWSLYQGEPRPRGASIFDGNPARFDLGEFRLDGHRLVISVDPAATAKTRADHSVATVCAMKGFGDNCKMWVLDVLRCQVTIPELTRRLMDLQRKWKCPLAIESVGAFNAIPDMIREAAPTLQIIPVPLKGDKFARAQPYAAAWNGGRVLIPSQAAWAHDYIVEHANFTGVGDKQDDQVDAGAHGYTALFRANPHRRGLMRTDFLPFG